MNGKHISTDYNLLVEQTKVVVSGGSRGRAAQAAAFVLGQKNNKDLCKAIGSVLWSAWIHDAATNRDTSQQFTSTSNIIACVKRASTVSTRIHAAATRKNCIHDARHIHILKVQKLSACI